MSEQRDVIYGERNRVIEEKKSLKWVLMPMINERLIIYCRFTYSAIKRIESYKHPDFATVIGVSPNEISMNMLEGKSADQIKEF